MPRTAVKACAAAVDRLRRPARGVVVLLYHRVGGRSDSSVDIPTELFEEQMASIAMEGRAATLDDAMTTLHGNTAPEVDPVVVTFDDGTADFTETVLPILGEYSIPAVLYLATDYIERDRTFPDDGQPLSWSAVRDAVSSGLVTVGSHTHTHALLDRVSAAEATRELDRSRELIAERAGVTAEHFAYPKARPGSPAADTVVRARFRSAAVGGMKPNRYGNTDPYRLARSPVQRGDGQFFFRHKLAGGMRLEGALREALDRRRYARNTS